jgi:glucose-6-phosphate 1-dehydrogenase
MQCTTTVLSDEIPDAAPVDPRFCAQDPFTLVIFGASGDLARRKLLPALSQLERGGYLPKKLAVVGFSRSELTDDAYRESMCEALAEAKASPEPGSTLIGSLHYVRGNNDDPASFQQLKRRVEELERERGLPGNRLFYLSVGPEYFATIVQQLAESGLVRDPTEPCWSRVIIEKPFGRDLESARALNAEVTRHLDESQVYRIDHYLGKETVQNLISFRLGNSIFEPLFNQKYVEHVQITVAETLGMENKRGGYYDTAGALRDMVQNHLLQLVTMIAMEPPSSLGAQELRDEKVKVLRALEPMSVEQVARDTVRGQYGPGEHAGERIKGYREEASVDPRSGTETFVALKLAIDNWRWAGVPFYLRTGKRLKQRISEIAVTFKQPPMHLFRELASRGEEAAIAHGPRANVLLLRIQPDEGISLTFAAKRPGMQVHLDDVQMDFKYQQFQRRSPEAYERLLLDTLRGDASLFTRSDEVEHAWRFIHSIQQGWAHMPARPLPSYAPFSDGPDEVKRLFEASHASFRPMTGS